ncbi:MAG: cysteine hydrolase [Dehalococcoidales bacterium]|nr:cysteine hydrolase [Dehalococcoidales bacterium]
MTRFRPPEFHPALLVIDMQNGFCSGGGSYEKYGGSIGANLDTYKKIIPNVARIIEACRETGISIFYTQQVREQSGIDLFTRLHRIVPERRAEFLRIPACIRGTWDADIIDELKPTENDHIVVKRRDSAFQDTELDLWLRSISADTLIFTGVDSIICVENTLTDAFNIGYDVILIEDAVASSWPNIGRATIRKVEGSYGWVVKTDQFINLLHTCRMGPGTFRFTHNE